MEYNQVSQAEEWFDSPSFEIEDKKQQKKMEENSIIINEDSSPRRQSSKIKDKFKRAFAYCCLYEQPKSELRIMGDFWMCIIFYVNTFYFISTFEECPDDNEIQCENFIKQFIERIHLIYIGQALTFALIFFAAIFQYFDKRLAYVSVIVFVYIVLFFDTQVTINHYGGAITLFMGAVTLLILIGLFLLLLLYKFYRKSQIGFFCLFGVLAFIGRYLYVNSCKTWEIGLNGVSLDRSSEYCELEKPPYCPISVMDSILDFSYWIDCSTKFTPKSLYLQFISHLKLQDRYLQFPITRNFKTTDRFCFMNRQFLLQANVLNRTQVIENLETQFKNGTAQYILDLEKMEYHIQVKRNETLVNERKSTKLHNQTLSQQIMVIFIDAVSRAQLYRTLPKTIQWIENREKQEKAKNVEFFRFYSLRPLTHPNFMAFQFESYSLDTDTHPLIKFPCTNNTFIYNLREDKIQPEEIDQPRNFIDFQQYQPECELNYQDFDNSDLYYQKTQTENKFQKQERNFYQNLRDAGYIIGRSSSQCVPNSANWATDYQSYYDQTADHEGISHSCDPYYNHPINPYKLLQGPYGMLKRCLNGQSVSEYTLEYGTQFWEAYQDDEAFLMMEFIDGHQPTGTVIKHLDEPLVQFLTNLEEKGLLNDTMIMFMSDHGNHNHVSQLIFNQVQMNTQRMNPFLIYHLPVNFVKSYPAKFEQLKKNSQKLLTQKNNHFFLQTWIQGFGYQYINKSMFSPFIPANLDCHDAVDHMRTFIIQNYYTYDELCVCGKIKHSPKP